MSGAGVLLPPFIVYKGKYLLPDNTQGGPIGTRYTVSENGWMTAHTCTFIDWFSNVFIPSLPEERPILLILDGHTSHVSLKVRKLAMEHKIELLKLKLPLHLTHLLQPLNVSVLKPMKAKWDEVVTDYTRRESHSVKKRDFPSLISEVWQSYKVTTGKNGFKKTGIIPYNEDVIPKESLKGYSPTPGPSTNSPSLSVSPGPSTNSPLSSVSPGPSTNSPSPVSPGPSASTNSSSSTSACTTASTSSATVSISKELQLHEYFGRMIITSNSQNQSGPPRTTSRCRLVGRGQSLTSVEAMKILHQEVEQKKQKEREKQERKQQRELKKKQKEEEKQQKEKRK